jgi:thioredoxin-related protein
MASFIEVIKKIISPYSKYILIALLIVIFLLAATYVYNKYYMEDMKKIDNKFADVANANKRTHEVIIYFFNVDWCPHCTSTKPEFEKLGSTQTIGGKTVRCVYVNPEKEPEAAKGFAVDGYPTLILQKSDGTQVKHSGPRTQAGFLEFLRGTV